jgi:hypothetical protein
MDVSGQLSRFLNYSTIPLLLEFCCNPGIQCSLGTVAVILSNVVTTKRRSCDNCKLRKTVGALYVSLSLVKFVWNRIKRYETGWDAAYFGRDSIEPNSQVVQYQLFGFCQTNRATGKLNKTGNVRIRYHGGAFVQPFWLFWTGFVSRVRIRTSLQGKYWCVATRSVFVLYIKPASPEYYVVSRQQKYRLFQKRQPAGKSCGVSYVFSFPLANQ